MLLYAHRRQLAADFSFLKRDNQEFFVQVATADATSVKQMGAFALARFIQERRQRGDPQMVEVGMKEMHGRAQAYSRLPLPHDPKCRWGN